MNSYDQIPYLSQPFSQSHPNRLATIAYIFGLTPPELSGARVLELGCASGNNIIPIAHISPQTECLGVDLSKNQITEGKKLIEKLGLKNIELKNCSIANIDESFGKFDYIICHGTFSWVPKDIQEAIFKVCETSLTDNGLAYISYNTLPGWHIRQSIREMLTFHTAEITDPNEQIKQAKSFAKLFESSLTKLSTSESIILGETVADIPELPDWYVYHDLLENVNDPVYFNKFISQADAHGLQYLGEANVSSMLPHDLSESARNQLHALTSDEIKREQYLDFLRMRVFRQTILCKKSQTVTRRWNSDCILKLLASASFVRKETEMGVEFINEQQNRLVTKDKLYIATLDYLNAQFPKRISFPELLDHLKQKNLSVTNTEEQELKDLLLKGYLSKMVNLNYFPASFSIEVSEKPIASSLARAQLEDKSINAVTNFLHDPIELDQLECFLLPLLDGTRDVKSLRSSLNEFLKTNASEKFNSRTIEDALNRFARTGLLAQ
jgi:methyltransferase-like protein/ubiquinone/menaquinone biosynthesis C-methylase UbiE